MNTTSKIAVYKGREYRLMFLGDTKFGKRAKLAFTDGSKEFWVPADAIIVKSGSPSYTPRAMSSRGSRRTGCSCGSIDGETRDSDCFSCKHDAQ